MIAGEHKTIIEIGSDFIFKIKVTDAIGAAMDITDFTVEFTIKYDNAGTIEYKQAEGSQAATPYSFTGTVTDGVAGELEVVIDKDITGVMTSLLSADANSIFATQYNFFYSLDIVGIDPNTDDIRVLRGKLAIRN